MNDWSSVASAIGGLNVVWTASGVGEGVAGGPRDGDALGCKNWPSTDGDGVRSCTGSLKGDSDA